MDLIENGDDGELELGAKKEETMEHPTEFQRLMRPWGTNRFCVRDFASFLIIRAQ